MNRAVADQLRELGVRGILTTAAEQGKIPKLECMMEECICPQGRGYFEPIGLPLTDWIPTEDHFPILKMDGGQRTVDNIRLAHRLCNRMDYAVDQGIKHDRDRAKGFPKVVELTPEEGMP